MQQFGLAVWTAGPYQRWYIGFFRRRVVEPTAVNRLLDAKHAFMWIQNLASFLQALGGHNNGFIALSRHRRHVWLPCGEKDVAELIAQHCTRK